MDDKQFRKAMGKFATGVTVILTEENGNVYGMTANAFMSVSLSPKLVTVSIGENARILNKIINSKVFTVNILASHQENISRNFSGRLKDEIDIDFDRLDGKAVLPGALAQYSCEVVSKHVEGDHTLFIGRVTDIHMSDKDPLIFYDGKYYSLGE